MISNNNIGVINIIRRSVNKAVKIVEETKEMHIEEINKERFCKK